MKRVQKKRILELRRVLLMNLVVGIGLDTSGCKYVFNFDLSAWPMCRKILIDTLLLKIATVVAFPHAYISTRTTNIISSNPLNSESRIRYIRLIDGYRAYSDQVIPRDEAGSGWGDIPKCACVLRGSG